MDVSVGAFGHAEVDEPLVAEARGERVVRHGEEEGIGADLARVGGEGTALQPAYSRTSSVVVMRASATPMP